MVGGKSFLFESHIGLYSKFVVVVENPVPNTIGLYSKNFVVVVENPVQNTVGLYSKVFYCYC